jgi:hypothetical protein
MQFYLGDTSQSAQFPVTLSAMYQANTASVPADNDPSWSVVGYLSSSQNNGASTYIVGAQTIPTGSYIYTKMRGPAGIKYGSWIGLDSTSAYFVSLSANYMQQPTRVASTGSTPIVLNNSGNGPFVVKKLQYPYTASGNLFTQSIIQNDELYVIVDNSLACASPMTMSFLYTQSATYPSYSDPKFQAVMFPVSGVTTPGQRVWNNGSVIDTNSGFLAITGSGYYYFKANSASGSMVTLSGSLTTTTSASAVLDTSASLMLRLAASSSVQSNRQRIRFTLNQGGTPFYSTAISASVYKNNCTGSFSTGSFETVTLAASYSSDYCSQEAAQAVAQAYFNANSQSWANASGSCSPTASYFPTLYMGSPDDVLDTWNFPLTYSVISTGSYSSGQVIGPPANNDPRWLPFGYRSGSQNTGSATTSIYYPLTVPTYYGSNCWVKVRDKFGNNIDYDNNIGNGTYYMFRVNTQGADTYAENGSLPHLNNNLTQSLGTGSDMFFEIINDGVTNWPGLPVTASYIYTSSGNFPTLGDAKWTPYAYWVSNSAAPSDWRAPNIKIAGVTQSIYNPTAGTGYFISQSGYYYFKLQTPNSFLITGSMAIENMAGYASASYQFSGSMLQLQIFNPTQSDDNQVTIKIGPSL